MKKGVKNITKILFRKRKKREKSWRRFGTVKNNIYDLYIFLCFFNNCIYSKNNIKTIQ